jgi:Uma2 family endonuclease
MATSAPVFVPLEEYLRTTYRPDRDWINGEVKERNLGEQSHARIQTFFAYLFRLNAGAWKLRGLTEQRVQTSAGHFRVPDVCAIPIHSPLVEILTEAPILCVEILSGDDSMAEIKQRVEDYRLMGVRTIWVVDPRRRRAYAADATGGLVSELVELTVPGTAIHISIVEIFAELDEVEAHS